MVMQAVQAILQVLHAVYSTSVVHFLDFAKSLGYPIPMVGSRGCFRVQGPCNTGGFVCEYF